MFACLQPKPGNWGDPSWMNVPKPNKGPGSWGDGGPDPNHWNMKRASYHFSFLHAFVFGCTIGCIADLSVWQDENGVVVASALRELILSTSF